jgi:hypothetical protein
MTLDFERWFQRQTRPAASPTLAAAPDLSDGLHSRDGKVMATCCICKNDYEWPAEPEEFCAESNYCGGSPRCCP